MPRPFALSRRGDVAKALSHAEAAVKLDPESSASRLNLGSVLLLNGNLTSAIAVYREASRHSKWPDSADAHLLLSKALESSGDRAGARAELSRFLQLCPHTDPRLETESNHLRELSTD